jgi:hypothetical protein
MIYIYGDFYILHHDCLTVQDILKFLMDLNS